MAGHGLSWGVHACQLPFLPPTLADYYVTLHVVLDCRSQYLAPSRLSTRPAPTGASNTIGARSASARTPAVSAPTGRCHPLAWTTSMMEAGMVRTTEPAQIAACARPGQTRAGGRTRAVVAIPSQASRSGVRRCACAGLCCALRTATPHARRYEDIRNPAAVHVGRLPTRARWGRLAAVHPAGTRTPCKNRANSPASCPSFHATIAPTTPWACSRDDERGPRSRLIVTRYSVQNLHMLTVDDNDLNGGLDPNMGLLPALGYFSVTRTNISGTLPGYGFEYGTVSAPPRDRRPWILVQGLSRSTYCGLSL